MTETVPWSSKLFFPEERALEDLLAFALERPEAARELKLGSVALDPRMTSMWPAATGLPAWAVTPNTAATLAAFARAAAPDPYRTCVADWVVE